MSCGLTLRGTFVWLLAAAIAIPTASLATRWDFPARGPIYLIGGLARMSVVAATVIVIGSVFVLIPGIAAVVYLLAAF